MASLVVRNIDNKIVQALKARAGAHGISAEAEHRKILETALFAAKKMSFSEVLCTIPNAGYDADFERKEDNQPSDVFD